MTGPANDDERPRARGMRSKPLRRRTGPPAEPEPARPLSRRVGIPTPPPSIQVRSAAERREMEDEFDELGPEDLAHTVILARGLTKVYNDEVTAVDDLDLEIRPGEVFGLLGPNGAGKTTTVLMLLGLSEPTSGIARVVGLDPAREPLEVKRRVGYLPDNVGFYGDMTGRDNLRYTARLNGLHKRVAEARIDELLGDVRLRDAADRRVDQYSRGMRQRLGIADALVKDPSVLILDEPTIAIDPAGVDEILGLLRRLVDERSLTIMLSSHILGQVQSICDRVGIFSSGRLVAQGSLQELTAMAGRGVIAFEVGADGDPDAIEGILRAVPRVSAVEREGGERQRWVVHAETDVAAAMTGALSAGGHAVHHLRRRGEDLLEIYRQLVPEGRDDRSN
jgi:ABC-2 type transport system ATP-binding protein